MRTSFIVAAALLTSIFAGCESDISQDEADATSCEGAYKDDNGRCRRADGRFASSSCCVVPYAPKRRDLSAYSCPETSGPIPVAFLDADSTLRIAKSGNVSATEIDDVYVLPFAAKHIKALNEQGVLTAIVSNQGGVSQGHETLETAEGALLYLAGQLHQLGARIDYLDLAENYDEFRKPKTGMAEKLNELLTAKCGSGVDMDKAFMVGDGGYKEGVDGPHPDGRPADDFSNADRLFAENLGIPFHEPTDYFGWRTWEVYNIHNTEELLGLLTAVDKEIAALRESGEDPDRAEELQSEVDGNRAVNGFD